MTLKWDNSHFGVIPRWNELGMRLVLIPLEWQGWPCNDWTGPGTTEWGGLPRGHSSFHPCHSSPIPSFWHHSKIQKQWWWPSNEGGVRPGSGPKLTTFPNHHLCKCSFNTVPHWFFMACDMPTNNNLLKKGVWTYLLPQRKISASFNNGRRQSKALLPPLAQQFPWIKLIWSS